MITRITGENQVTVSAEVAAAEGIEIGTRLAWSFAEREHVLEVRVLKSVAEVAAELRAVERGIGTGREARSTPCYGNASERNGRTSEDSDPVKAVTHVLDTSAILAHYFDEPGAALVEELWQDSGSRVGICVLTLPELKGRLAAEVPDRQGVERAFSQYVDDLTVNLIVDRAAAESAMLLRESAETRLPLIDALIAERRTRAVISGCRVIMPSI